MPVKVIQPSFTGGEVTPALHDRVDLAKYSTSLAECKNFLIHTHGGISNRPGLEFIVEAYDDRGGPS